MSVNDSGQGGLRRAMPSVIAALLSEGKGADFWDRPRGDWGKPQVRRLAEREQRRHANSCYRLGSAALRTGDLELARNWLRRALEEQHPGAAFRLAVALWRSGPDLAGEAVPALVSAARWGHGDAQVLLYQAGWDLAGIGLSCHEDSGVRQDGEFTADIEALLHTVRPSRRQGEAVRIPHPRTTAAEALWPRVREAAGGAQGVVHRRDVPGERSPVPAPAPGPRWAPGPLRQASLMDMAQQVPGAGRPARRWQSAQRVLELLHIIASAGMSVSERHLAQATSLSRPVVQRLLVWLGQQQLVQLTPDGGYVPGVALRLLAAPHHHRRGAVIGQVLAALRDAVGAAVYIGTYRNGEVEIAASADGPSTPGVRKVAPFEDSAHATALGKSLLAQLTFEQRMDHLARRRPIMLTQRTITDRASLFHSLDGYGPHASQFDLFEYSNGDLCFAVPLRIGNEIGCVALSLPHTQRHRLLQAAKTLSSRSAGLLLSLLLATAPPALESGRHDALMPRHVEESLAPGPADFTKQPSTRLGVDHWPGELSEYSFHARTEAEEEEEQELDAVVLQFPVRTLDPPLVPSPDVLTSTSLLLAPAVAGSRH
ncbi:IclR family transcriptional regulator domain-containing protein [Streptomyces sp. NBC_01431]|uniref:IclR family transcriptional regulator domain-containing protein n=1 Tax=Streptomyces sp. NBC_01431 TaxID=2903863 RepID=UPI002E347CF3|nr:IclR family transcriptional regulator C-terminal domain-containing protein [Streptomyces sp. NBC_01431]